MGYYVKELKNKKSIPQWKLQFVSHKKEHTPQSAAKKPKKEWDIPKDRWDSLGFKISMSIGMAKCHARQLNSKSKLKLDELRRKKFLETQQVFELECSAILPEVFKREFEARFILGRAPHEDRRNIASHWRTSQAMILSLKIDPSNWFEESLSFYDYFLDKHYSLSYLRKILRLANLWGFYICKKLGKPFLPVPSPAGHEKKRLLSAYYAFTEKPRSESASISPIQLSSIKDKIHPHLYSWIYLSVWLGLRPLEVDNLKKDGLHAFETTADGTTVLWIHQTKLVGVPPWKRWKPIPLIFDEQKEVVNIIKNSQFQRPLIKTMRHHFGQETTLYGGRKGFTDLMLSRNQGLEHIAQWMGHSSIERTWRHYKSRHTYHYNLNGIMSCSTWTPSKIVATG
jgi:integrase